MQVQIVALRLMGLSEDDYRQECAAEAPIFARVL
jgi:hypothetical protein